MNHKLDTDFLDRAIIFAVKAHAGTERRVKGFPYIVHPLEAMAIVATMTNDQEMLAAAALHDTIEDTSVTYSDIKLMFGERVAKLVQYDSEQKTNEENQAESWHARKQAAIDRLAAAPHDAKMIALGDKLSNMRAIARDYDTEGDKLWNRFHVSDVKEHSWHYHGLVESLRELSDTEAFQEFEALVNKVFP